MAGALRGEGETAHPLLYWEYEGRGFQQAARQENWKAVRPGRVAGTELYDLAADPAERHDVAADHPGIVAALERQMAAARTESSRWPRPGVLEAWLRRAPRVVAGVALALGIGLATLAMLRWRGRRRAPPAPA
jgi:arylsulfatase A-like enzyme